MWSPTHIQVTVQRAKGLLIKGKHGTNNCFVIIALGKEKYTTSVKEKAPEAVEWHEECELQIPSQGNRAELVLTALHHNTLGLDEFLGQVVLPLNEMDVYERPRSRWFKLQSKPGKEKKKERGELEVRIAFTVKAGSLTDLSKKEKNKSSVSNLASNVGGSLLSIGAIEKRKSLKKFAKSLGSKVHISGIGKKKNKDVDSVADDASFTGSYSSIGTPSGLQSRQSRQTFGDADPGVISEDEDEFVFDNLSHKSSGSSLNTRAQSGAGHILPKSTTQSSASTPDETRKHKAVTLPPSKPPRLLSENESEPAAPAKVDEWEQKLYGKHLEIGNTDSLKRRSWESSRVMLSVQQEEDEEQHQKKAPQEPSLPPTSATAPTSPLLTDKTQKEESEGYDKPRPLPRAGSQDISKVSDKLVINNGPITGNSRSNSRKSINQPSPKLEKQDNSSFTKKLKHFIKDHRAESMENLSGSRKQLNGATKHQHVNERIIIGGENGSNGTGDLPISFLSAARQSKLVTEVSPEIMAKYEGKTREDMMKIAHNLENEVNYQKQKVKELEDYLDSLLLKVMECQPRILQNPYQKANPTKRKSNGVVSSLEVVTSFKAKRNPLKAYSEDERLRLHDWPLTRPAIGEDFDLGVVVSFGHLIPESLIAAFRLGMLNVHASLLPKLRGAAPIVHAIRNGDTETGITIMKIKPMHFDVGEILTQRHVPITEHMLMPELHSQLAEIGASALLHCVENLEQYYSALKAQNGQDATYAPKIDAHFCEIRWTEMTAKRVYDQYRSLYSYKPLTSRLGNDPVKIFKLSYPSQEEQCDPTLPVGHIQYCRKTKRLRVGCREGGEVLIEQLSIGGKKVMSALEFNNGFLRKMVSGDRVFR